MIFRFCEENEKILYRREIVRLQCDAAEDAGGIKAFDATYFDAMGRKRPLGPVKIGMRGHTAKKMMELLPKEFTELPKDCFSLGQDEYYYENLSHLDQRTRQSILDALRDFANDPEQFDNWVKNEKKEARQSLLRGLATDEKVAIAKVKGQFRNMARGKARLTPYHFTYTAPKPEDEEIQPVSLDFVVNPKPQPPTNVHALIGRNGCGKTYLIRHMVQCLQNGNGADGTFVFHEVDGLAQEFVNVICVAFSPFDNFAALIQDDGDLPATFVGLKKTTGTLLDNIYNQFWKHFQNCLVTEQKQLLWKNAIDILRSDEIFDREGIREFMNGLTANAGEAELSQKSAEIKTVFNRLSSGHKVVLLIVTSCVAEIEERSILFLDEPENHLHPPLLSALIRALSDLLMDRNGVAIISTHSPIVLQEIPSNCVWVLDRDEFNEVSAHRPNRETFGTNLGALIYDTFDLEMRKSGFRRLLREAVEQYGSYEAVDKAFGSHLGNEAELLLRTLIMLKEREAQE